MDVKSFTLGYKAGASKGGGNVSQAELEEAIKKVVPEWALEETPPQDAVTSVNGQVGAVNLPIPSEAADVGADPVGTAETEIKTHNTDNDAHEYIQQRIDTLRTLVENFLDIDDESFDQLSEILRDIRANTSALELLGTNKVDKTAISTSMTDSNPEHVASMTLIVALDNALTVVEQAIEDLKTNKQTAAQVAAAINNALSGYLTSVKAAELYQPKGDYLTPTTGDQRYPAKQTTEGTLTEHARKIAELEKALENATIEFAESVEWLEENGDTSKKYYLPDGYEYAWMQKTVEVTHNANDGSCSDDARPTANATVDTQLVDKNGCLTTAPIALDKSKSDFTVSLSGLDKLYLNYYAACYVYYFDANGAWLGHINPGNATAGLGATLDSDNNLPLPSTFDVSKGTYFASATQIRIMMGITANTSISADDYASLVINCAWLNSTEEVWGWYSTGVLHSNDKATQQNSADIAYLKENVAAIEEDATVLREETDKIPRPSGAVWYALGDSITKGEGWGGVTADTCWYAHVLKYNGYDPEKSRKIAYSGLGFAKADPNFSKTARTLVDENDFSGVDLVTIAIGINDWKEPHSIDTVKAEMGYCFEKILGDNPCCKIFFITPMNVRMGSKSTNWALGYSGGTGGNLGQFVEAQMSVCKDYGIQVVDMTYGSVVNRENIETILADAYHPTPAGHLAMARELARKITFV